MGLWFGLVLQQRNHAAHNRPLSPCIQLDANEQYTAAKISKPAFHWYLGRHWSCFCCCNVLICNLPIDFCCLLQRQWTRHTQSSRRSWHPVGCLQTIHCCTAHTKSCLLVPLAVLKLLSLLRRVHLILTFWFSLPLPTTTVCIASISGCMMDKAVADFAIFNYGKTLSSSFLTKAIQCLPFSSQCIHNIHCSNSLAVGVFSICHRISNNVLQEHLQNTLHLIVHDPRDSLDPTPPSKAADGRLGNALNVVPQDTSMAFCPSFAKTFATFSPAWHVYFWSPQSSFMRMIWLHLCGLIDEADSTVASCSCCGTNLSPNIALVRSHSCARMKQAP